MKPDETNAPVHSVALMLPAWLNGTLSERERGEVDAHLAACDACRRELEEYSSLRTRLSELYAGEPGASPQAFRGVMAQIGQVGPLQRLDGWLRSLLGAPWAPTFAGLLVVAQLGALTWMASQRPEPEVVSRSVPAPGARLRVGFLDTATEREIRALLKEVGGRIVDGPSPEGVYVVEIPAATDAAARALLARRTDLVRTLQ